MEYGFASHLLVWAIGGIVALGVIALPAAFWALGRSGYRDD